MVSAKGRQIVLSRKMRNSKGKWRGGGGEFMRQDKEEENMMMDDMRRMTEK